MKSTCVLCEPARQPGSTTVASRDATLPRRCQWLQRTAKYLSWIAPTALLVLIPKCPACLAAYVAAGTGFGISLALAENVRVGLIVVSFAALSWLALRLVRERSSTVAGRCDAI